MDLLEKLKELAENGSGPRKEPVRTKVVWNVVEKGDKVLLLLPNIQMYTGVDNEQIFQEFRETITAILAAKPSYVLLYVSGIDHTHELLQFYETVYGTEIQWLSDIRLLHNEQFMEYHSTTKLYFLKEHLLDIDIEAYISRVILDVLDYDHDILSYIQDTDLPIHYGKCFMEEVVNIQVYLNKLITRINSCLSESSHQEYDVSFIIGKTSSPWKILQDVLVKTCKQNQCTLLFSCHPEVSKHLPEMKKELKLGKIPLVDYETEVLDIDMIHDLVGRLQRVSTKYTTHVFIGAFSFETKEVLEVWKKHTDTLQTHSIFDVDAYDSLLAHLSPQEKQTFRISKEPIPMLEMFLSGSTDPLEKNKRDPSYEEEEPETYWDEEEEDS